jgi:hypothetical protein
MISDTLIILAIGVFIIWLCIYFAFRFNLE